MLKKYLFLILAAALLLSSCTQTYRSIKYWIPGTGDYDAFPQAQLQASEDPFYFHPTEDSIAWDITLTLSNPQDTSKFSLDELLDSTTTTAFVIIRNDSVLFENYYEGYGPSDIATIFSVTKSVTATLAGIAVKESAIHSVKDPVTKYIPELKDGDPKFQQLTIENLLNMEAGLDFEESYSNPFKNMARLFYGRNQLRYLQKIKFACEPGEKHDYNSATTALLGIVVERATGKSYTNYLQEKLWTPLGMQFDATMGLDDKKHRSAKSYASLNTTALDLAKIGRLYLNQGQWKDEQILSADWVQKSATPNIHSDFMDENYYGYQYHWYSKHYMAKDSTGTLQFSNPDDARNYAKKEGYTFYNIRKDKKEGYYEIHKYLPQYYGLGFLGQVLYVDPVNNLIMVRLGKTSDFGYPHLMYVLGKKLGENN